MMLSTRKLRHNIKRFTITIVKGEMGTSILWNGEKAKEHYVGEKDYIGH